MLFIRYSPDNFSKTLLFNTFPDLILTGPEKTNRVITIFFPIRFENFWLRKYAQP